MICLLLLRLHNAVQLKQKDKQTISQLEKKLKAEQEARAFVEKQLMEEKKRKKLEEATAARAVAFAAASRYPATFYSQFCFGRLAFWILVNGNALAHHLFHLQKQDAFLG